MVSGGLHVFQPSSQSLPVAAGGQDNNFIPFRRPLSARPESPGAIPDFAEADAEQFRKGKYKIIGNHLARKATTQSSGHIAPGKRMNG